VAGCSTGAPAPQPPPASAPPSEATPGPGAGQSPSPSPSPSPGGEAAGLLARMSLEDKVGQLFMIVVYGPRAGAAHQENTARYGVATPAEVVRRFRPGGVILFPWAGNISTAEQVAALTTGLRKASPLVPLMVGVDQENGEVARLGSLVTKLPGAPAIGRTRDPRLARDVARVTGEELRDLGIAVDFAPVADVSAKGSFIRSRAYGSDPKLVSAMVRAAVEGFHAAGVASVAKHFPGHGGTSVDSHQDLPVITYSKARWRRVDAPPFRAAIERGVDAIMTAHVAMPRLDPSGDPATLSRAVITGLLRGELGYDGVVVTDALDMAGVRKRYGDAEVAVRAILAGADLLLMPPDLPTAYQAVLTAVRSGRIPERRIDESVLRILRLKERRGILGPTRTDPGGVKSAEHLKVARRVAAAIADAR